MTADARRQAAIAESSFGFRNPYAIGSLVHRHRSRPDGGLRQWRIADDGRILRNRYAIGAARGAWQTELPDPTTSPGSEAARSQ